MWVLWTFSSDPGITFFENERRGDCPVALPGGGSPNRSYEHRNLGLGQRERERGDQGKLGGRFYHLHQSIEYVRVNRLRVFPIKSAIDYLVWAKWKDEERTILRETGARNLTTNFSRYSIWFRSTAGELSTFQCHETGQNIYRSMPILDHYNWPFISTSWLNRNSKIDYKFPGVSLDNHGNRANWWNLATETRHLWGIKFI